MSFKARLNVGGKELNVLSCDFSLEQKVDATGRPSTVSNGGYITCTVESTDSTVFAAWAANNFERKDGKITFLKRDTEAKLKEIEFKEGYLVKYEERFDNTSEFPMVETFTVSAKEVRLGDMEVVKEWPI